MEAKGDILPPLSSVSSPRIEKKSSNNIRSVYGINYHKVHLWKLKPQPHPKTSKSNNSQNELGTKPCSNAKIGLYSHTKAHHIQFSLSQWNARSIQSKDKLDFIENLPGSLIFLQEIWHRASNIKGIGQQIGLIERDIKEGGGTATLNLSNMKIQVLSSFQINKDSQAIKVRIDGNFLWICNIYIHIKKVSKIQKLFGKLRSSIPPQEWNQILIAGDFNVDIAKPSECELLIRSLSKQMGLTVQQPPKPTRKTAYLDYMISGSLIKVLESQCLNSLSDHKVVTWHIEVSCPKKPHKQKIPSKSTAVEITTTLLQDNKIVDSQSFIKALEKQRRGNKKKLTKSIKRTKPRTTELLDKLLELDDPSEKEIKSQINSHWHSFWSQVEKDRWSQQSAHSYHKLKNILKYHLFEGKRDGGIISQVIEEDGTIVDDPKEVASLLKQTIIDIQVDERWGWLKEEPFPKLSRLTTEQTMELMKLLSTNKAIAHDALNKIFPDTPTRKQMRPIVIQSPLIKLLEARFLIKLQAYLIHKLDRSQIGFVKGMGTQVNLWRAIERIKLRTTKSKPVYGLFIDFSNAYNSVPHTLLFEKLQAKKIFEDDELQFLKCLYARYKLRIGDSSFKTNKGVAQGSILSPALFNIFIEDLSEELKDKADISLEDLLLYADDILALTTSPTQLAKAIRIIEDWCKRNGMDLNKKKIRNNGLHK